MVPTLNHYLPATGPSTCPLRHAGRMKPRGLLRRRPKAVKAHNGPVGKKRGLLRKIWRSSLWQGSLYLPSQTMHYKMGHSSKLPYRFVFFLFESFVFFVRWFLWTTKVLEGLDKNNWTCSTWGCMLENFSSQTQGQNLGQAIFSKTSFGRIFVGQLGSPSIEPQEVMKVIGLCSKNIRIPGKPRRGHHFFRQLEIPSFRAWNSWWISVAESFGIQTIPPAIGWILGLPVILPEVNGIWMVCFWGAGPVIPHVWCL